MVKEEEQYVRIWTCHWEELVEASRALLLLRDSKTVSVRKEKNPFSGSKMSKVQLDPPFLCDSTCQQLTGRRMLSRVACLSHCAEGAMPTTDREKDVFLSGLPQPLWWRYHANNWHGEGCSLKWHTSWRCHANNWQREGCSLEWLTSAIAMKVPCQQLTGRRMFSEWLTSAIAMKVPCQQLTGRRMLSRVAYVPQPLQLSHCNEGAMPTTEDAH